MANGQTGTYGEEASNGQTAAGDHETRHAADAATHNGQPSDTSAPPRREGSASSPTSTSDHDEQREQGPGEENDAPATHEVVVDAVNGRQRSVDQNGRKKTFMEKVEIKLSGLSSRSNFWHRVCSWIWLPFAYRSGISFRRDGHSFAAVLPFRRFNRNWYSAMAGAALLGNSEIAGGMFVFRECGGNYRVVCKELNYKFMRPCVGPAMYRMTPREDIKQQVETGGEFNVILDMEVVQIMRAPKENRERRVGRCTATFHVTPQDHGRDAHRRKGRKYHRQ